jgi:hypothetical protein
MKMDGEWRAVMYKNGLPEGLCVETVARDGKIQSFSVEFF